MPSSDPLAPSHAGAAGQPSTEAMPQLEALRPLVITLHDFRRNGPPLSYRWGMYAGNLVGADVDSLYYTNFRQARFEI